MSWERLLHSVQSKKPTAREDFLNNKASSDPFEQEAMEGWNQISTSNRKASLNRLDKKFKSSFPTLPVISISIVLVISGTFFFWQTKETTSDSSVALVEITDLVEESNFTDSTPIILEQKEENRALKEQQKKTVAPKEISPTNPEKQETNKTTTISTKVDTLPTNEFNKIEQQKPNLNLRTKAKEINVFHFTLVDYRTLRSRPAIPTQQLELTGTSADKESRDQEEAETSIKTVDIPYMDYIEKTMYYLDHGSMKKTLNRLENILEVYPDDVNALFYAGFVCFQMGQFEQSIFYLNQLKPINISNFDQERDWYLVKNYLRTKQTQKAKELLKEIATSSSFYAKQAQKELNENPVFK